MSRFPKMLFRDGDMLPEHGVDYLIVECEAEMVNALGDGWREELEAPQVSSRHPLAPADALFDRNGDGRPGGSLPAAQRGLDDLKAEAEALGITIDRRWGEKRLLAEIAKASA